MRRRPHKDQCKHQYRFDRHAARCRQPSDHRRECARRTTDNDVLRCPTLKPHCVDHNIEENRKRQQPCRIPIGGKPQHHNRDARKRDAKCLGLIRGDFPCRDWTFLGATHYCVDVGIIPHVQCTRGTTAQRDEQDRGKSDKRMDRNGCRQ